MTIKFHNLIQGSPEWHDFRNRRLGASEASAMMGKSPYMSRTQLLERKATGIGPEVDAVTQARFDNGHIAESSARAIWEQETGLELFPVTITNSDYPGLSASLDGRTLDGSTIWEHKLWNESKAEDVRAGKIPECDYWQVVHQLTLTEAKKCIYVVSDGTADKRVSCECSLDMDDANTLLAAWEMFGSDLAFWKPTEKAAPIVAASIEGLPSVRVQVSGQLSIKDNFDEFGQQLQKFVAEVLIRDPQNDQDFADLESQIKTLRQAEDALDAAEEQIMSQVDAVDAAKRMKDQLHRLARDNRLMVEKLVKEQKSAIKLRIAAEAKEAIEAHVNTINSGLPAGYSLPEPAYDIGGAMKGKRTIDTLREAATNEANRAKVESTIAAEKLRANIKTLEAGGHGHLFADRQQLVLKSADDLEATIKARIADEADRKRQQQEAEKARIQSEAEAAAERERQRIREEEQAKARAEAERQRETEEATAKSTEPAVPDVKHDAPDAESDAIEAMQRFGGSFVQALGIAWARADEGNRARLRGAFPELLAKYAKMV